MKSLVIAGLLFIAAQEGLAAPGEALRRRIAVHSAQAAEQPTAATSIADKRPTKV